MSMLKLFFVCRATFKEIYLFHFHIVQNYASWKESFIKPLDYGNIICCLEYRLVSNLRMYILSPNYYTDLSIIDPYVKVIIMYKDKRIFKWKSSVKRNASSPVYNESFNYEVAEDMKMVVDIVNVMISFCIIDHYSMGIISVGKNASSKLGKQHWNQVLQYPSQ